MESSRGTACYANFYSDYRNISVPATFWRRGDAYYCDPGGEGGFHHRLRHGLAPYVSNCWNSRAVNMNVFNNTLSAGNLIDQYFQQRRQDLANVLINFSQTAPRQDLLGDYRTAVQALDAAIYRLKVFAFLAGKDINAAPFNRLIDSRTIAAEITSRAGVLREANLIPGVRRELSSRTLSGMTVTGAPAMNELPFQHPLNLLNLNRRYLQAQNLWRTLRFTEVNLAIPTPEIQRGYQKVVLFAEGMELPKNVPSDTIYLYKAKNELRPTAYWNSGDRIEFKSLELHRRKNGEIIKLLASVKDRLEITRENKEILIDKVTEDLELKLPIVSIPAYMRSLPADTHSLIVQNRILGDEIDCFEIGIGLIRHPHITELTLSNVEITREKLAILAKPIKDKTDTN